MPSRSAHRAALRRSQEPNVIAPEGITLPDLPNRMNWHNPVIGDRTDRDRWDVLNVGPGGAVVVASVHRGEQHYAEVFLPIPGSPLVPAPRTLPIAQAFEVAAEFARTLAK